MTQKPYLDRLHKYEEAGFSHVFMHQIGPDQDGFFRFCERELMPQLGFNGTRRKSSRPANAQQPQA